MSGSNIAGNSPEEGEHLRDLTLKRMVMPGSKGVDFHSKCLVQICKCLRDEHDSRKQQFGHVVPNSRVQGKLCLCTLPVGLDIPWT